MRAVFGLAIALTFLCPGMAHAANPFELKSNKDNKGMVIIEIDDSPRSQFMPPLPFGLAVTWFDTASKKPQVKMHWVSSPDMAKLEIVSDDDGHRYLVGPISEGEALVAAFGIQGNWNACYNAETYHFFIKGTTYSFLGRLNPYPSNERIFMAVNSGRMPRSTQSSMGNIIPPLTDTSLTPDFVPASDLPEEKTRIEALLLQKLGKPIEVLTPELHKTDYNLTKNLYGQTSCVGLTLMLGSEGG